MIISSCGLDQPWSPDCNYRLSARLLCHFILSIHAHFQAVQSWVVGFFFSLQLKFSQSPEASMTAVSQIEFAIPRVAFVTVVQTPSSKIPVWGAALDTLCLLTPWGQNWRARFPLHIFLAGQHRHGLVMWWNGCAFLKCAPHVCASINDVCGGRSSLNKGNEWAGGELSVFPGG